MGTLKPLPLPLSRSLRKFYERFSGVWEQKLTIGDMKAPRNTYQPTTVAIIDDFAPDLSSQIYLCNFVCEWHNFALRSQYGLNNCCRAQWF